MTTTVVVLQGRPGRQLSRATQTVSAGDSLPHVVVTAPSPDDRRHEPTVLRPVRSPPSVSPSGRGRPRLSAISYTPDSTSPNHVDDPAARFHDGLPATSDQRATTGDELRRRVEEAEVQALLRDLGVEPSSV